MSTLPKSSRQYLHASISPQYPHRGIGLIYEYNLIAWEECSMVSILKGMIESFLVEDDLGDFSIRIHTRPSTDDEFPSLIHTQSPWLKVKNRNGGYHPICGYLLDLTVVGVGNEDVS